MFCVLEIVDSTRNLGSQGACFEPDGSGFETEAARDACCKHYLFHEKKLAWMRWTTLVETYHSNDDFAKAIDEGVGGHGR